LPLGWLQPLCHSQSYKTIVYSATLLDTNLIGK
jgi:hypothetical protein